MLLSLLPDILRDQGLPQEAAGDTRVVQGLWKEVTSPKVCKLKGPCLQMSRWMSSIDCVAYWDPVRTMRSVLMLFWCMVTGLHVFDVETRTYISKSLSTFAPGMARQTLNQSSLKGAVAAMRHMGHRT